MADFYLFVMLLWAVRFEVTAPEVLVQLRDRLDWHRDRPRCRCPIAAQLAHQRGNGAGIVQHQRDRRPVEHLPVSGGAGPGPGSSVRSAACSVSLMRMAPRAGG